MRVFGKTDVGQRRQTNQDTFICEMLENMVILCVCDGMGGENGGDIASSHAVQSFYDLIKSNLYEDISQENLIKLLSLSVETTNNHVYKLAKDNQHLSRMGTTLVGGVLVGDSFYVANVGDSRCYHITNQAIIQITKDHSVVQEMLDAENDTYDDIDMQSLKKYLTKAIGDPSGKDCDIYQIKLNQGDYILLCSDGLHNLIDDSTLFEVMSLDIDIDKKCDLLIAGANGNGGYDNITVAILQY